MSDTTFTSISRECPLCGFTKANRTFHAQERMFNLGGDFIYMECGSCKALSLLDAPSDLSSFYPEDYYSFADVASEGRSFRSGLRNAIVRAAIAHRSGQGSLLGAFVVALTGKFKWIRKDMFRWDTPILDVGCGSGALLRMLANVGFTDLTGIDPFIASTLELPEGITIHKNEVHELDRRFGFIMMNHVFEHLPAPRGAMKALKDRLEPGGLLMIRIPVADSYCWEHYRDRWVQLDAPRHCFLHTEQSMRTLAGSVGLSLDHVEYDSTEFQFVGSEKYVRGLPLDAPLDHLSASQIRRFKRTARKLNGEKRGDTASFYLRV